MKKEYTKPFLAVESFQMDAAIAGGCSSNGKVPLNFTVNACNLVEEVPGEEIFGAACADNIVTESTQGNDGFCYHAFAYNAQEVFITS